GVRRRRRSFSSASSRRTGAMPRARARIVAPSRGSAGGRVDMASIVGPVDPGAFAGCARRLTGGVQVAGSVRAWVGGRDPPSTVGEVSVVFRATDEPVRTRLDYWRHVLGGTLGPLDLQAPQDPDFHDRLVAEPLGAVHVGDITVHQ